MSADADPFTGYEEYFTGFTGDPLEDGWGGTSFVAPQLNGVDRADRLAARAPGRLLEPGHLPVRRATGNSPFTPLDRRATNNDNLFYTGTPGHIYNVGSGLGYAGPGQAGRDFARTH